MQLLPIQFGLRHLLVATAITAITVRGLVFLDVMAVPILVWAIYSWVGGAIGLWMARRWISPEARWYEWGILSALIAAFTFPLVGYLVGMN